MISILIDTSVWLDLAQDQRQVWLIDALAEMVRKRDITLVVPPIVISEFQKNRQQVAQRAQQSLSTHFNLVKDAIRKAGRKDKKAERVLEYLSDVNHRIPLEGGMATGALDRIESLLKGATPVEASDSLKLRAMERALGRKAPCHQNKNSIADGVIIETYIECVRRGTAEDRFAFVTHNKRDFSDTSGDQRCIHPDLAAEFSTESSLYFVTLADCLRHFDPEALDQLAWEVSFQEDVRSLSEILDAMDVLTTQVWFNRHKNLEWKIKAGKHKIVTRSEWEANWQRRKGYTQNHTIDSVWKGALRSGKRAEKKLGKGNTGPWSDFEWGMINGKLSALRWALGDEWDMLDT